ncbi:reverse transcriptase domain-containing protein [Tanacetum coccineum]|uniref:Reverse transcriptase domain-containing protein n=1 Tax=Tanacetum coccineum TaxID=301880 RepID=A0ABQ5DJF2_9ASTR
MDQEKTPFTCPFRTYAYRRMPFGLCNAPATFQRCMLAIFHDMIEESMEVFMDGFSVFGNSFDNCLNKLDKMLQRCKDANLVLNWEKCHFMVKEGIVLGHKVSGVGLEVDKEKVDVIFKLPSPTNVKGIRSTENVAADHLSRIDNDETSDNSDIEDKFPRETLLGLKRLEGFLELLLLNNAGEKVYAAELQVASDDLLDAFTVIYLVFAHLRRSVSIRCQGYIGDFVLGCHAKDMVALCFGKLMNVGKTPHQGQTQSWLMTLASFVDKPSKTFDVLMITPTDFSAYIMNGLKITNLTQETLLGPAFILLKGTHANYIELEYDFEECYMALLEKLDWENPEGGDYPFDLTKLLPLVMSGNHQKTKAAQYDLPGIEDMVLNIWSPVKVAYDKHANSGRGDFPRLRINDIEDMLLLVVQNRLTNLSGDDVSDFVIALRMFTRSLVIQKRVEDLQLGVESYQKKINITKPKTTKPSIKKRNPYTPYQDPQRFIYVDTLGRNKLMRSEELYKFSDRTLTRLRTLLYDIIKNIRMEYLPKRRWSTL